MDMHVFFLNRSSLFFGNSDNECLKSPSLKIPAK